MTFIIAEQLAESLELWIELTGVDPSSKAFSMKIGGGMDNYTVSQMHSAVKEALDLDTSNVTGCLLLDALSTQYFNERSFSVDDLLKNSDKTTLYIDRVRRFKSLVQSPEIQEIGSDFELKMREALRHYKSDTSAVMNMLADRHELAYLRRDALRSMKNLRVDQFLTGELESKDVKPAYNEFVHQFWNINSLIQSACHQPSGVTLNLIRDPDDYQSYFAFAIRNGGNLFVLSDVPMHAHPLQRFMARRPDREFGRRASQNWFPYDLLNIKFDDEGRMYFDRSSQRGLIPLQQQADKLKNLRYLQPAEVIWIVMMFDLIVERFWHKGFQSPELTYTGQMVVEETPLIDAANQVSLPVVGYQPLALKALKVADVRQETISKSAIGKDGGAQNQWMEDRYSQHVGNDVVNLISKSGTEFYLEPIKAETDHKNHESAMVLVGDILSVGSKANHNLASWEKRGRYELHALDATSFGTRQELEDNRGFLARHNLAKAIQKLADQEFEDRNEEIKCWWEKSVRNNIEALYRMALVPEVWRKIDKARYPHGELRFQGSHYQNEYPMAQFFDEVELSKIFSYGVSADLKITGGWTRERGGAYLCALNETRASYSLIIQPQTPDDLAELAGCNVEDLPDILKHWSPRSRCNENHLLNRVDPMSWALHNPWEKMRFTVLLALSKRGLKSLQKSHVPPEKYLLEHIKSEA